MAKSKYGFSSLKRAPPTGRPAARPSTTETRGGITDNPLPLDETRDEDDIDERRDATVEEEERYSGVAATAPIFLSPGEQAAVRLFRKRVQEIAMVDPLMLGSSERSISDYWIKGRHSPAEVDASAKAYMRYTGLAVVYKDKV